MNVLSGISLSLLRRGMQEDNALLNGGAPERESTAVAGGSGIRCSSACAAVVKPCIIQQANYTLRQATGSFLRIVTRQEREGLAETTP